MDKEKARKELVNLASRILGTEELEIGLDETLEDLGADSLDSIEFLMAIEDHFDIGIPDEDAEPLKTINQAVDYLEKRLG